MNPRSITRELRKRLESVDREIDNLTLRLETLRTHRASLQDVIRMYDIETEADDEVDPQPAKEIRNSMVEILRSTGEPIYYRTFVGRLAEMGITVNGKDPAKTVSAHLSNDERFVKVGKGSWALASWPASQRQLRTQANDNQPRVLRFSDSRDSGQDRLTALRSATPLFDELTTDSQSLIDDEAEDPKVNRASI